MSPPPVPTELMGTTPKSAEELKGPEIAALEKANSSNKEKKEKAPDNRASEIFNNLKDSASKASKSVFSRLQSGARSISSGAGRLLARTLGVPDFETFKADAKDIGQEIKKGWKEGAEEEKKNIEMLTTAEGRGQLATMAGEGAADLLRNEGEFGASLIEQEDIDTAVSVAEHPIDAAVGTTAEVGKHLAGGALDLGRDLGVALRNTPEAARYAASDLWEGFKKGFGEIGRLPGMIAENRKANLALEALAAQEAADGISPEEKATKYTPEAIQRSAEAEAQVAYDKMYEETSASEQVAEAAREFALAGIELVGGMPKAALEMAKFAANDIFIETAKGNLEGLNILATKMAEGAGRLYTNGKESAGARIDQAVEVVARAKTWLEGVFKYQKENKSQLVSEAISANDELQNSLAELRLANAKNRPSDSERLARLIQQGKEIFIKQGFEEHDAESRAEVDADRILTQENQSAERITAAFAAIRELSKLEQALPDVAEIKEIAA